MSGLLGGYARNKRFPELDTAFMHEAVTPHGKLSLIQLVAHPGFQVEGKLQGCPYIGIIELGRYQCPENIFVVHGVWPAVEIVDFLCIFAAGFAESRYFPQA